MGSVAAELSLDRLTGHPVYPFLPAFAAVIAGAAFAGAGPGIASTALLVVWAAFDLRMHAETVDSIFLRCLFFAAEGLLLSYGSARLWNAKRAADSGELWHRRLVETAGEGIWVRNDSGIVTYANARMAEMLGIPLAELVGRGTDDFFFPADVSVERIRAENLRLGRQLDRKEQFDRRLRRADGSELWVLTCSNLVEDGEDNTTAALSMMTDITERKRAEYALRRSEERFRNLFESVLEGVYQSTPDGRVLAANPMLLRMLAVESEAEWKNVDIARDFFVDPNARRRLRERLEQEGSVQNFEYDLRCRDGRIISISENARAVRDESGNIVCFEGTMTDITPRKRMEEQLRQVQKAEAVARLAGSIAHDFNDVLTVVTGYAQLVLTELDADHPARPSAEQVVEAAGGAIALTRQLLSFSRSRTPAHGSLDLNRAVERAQPALQLLLGDHVPGNAPGKRIPLMLTLGSDVAPVHSSQSQIELTLLSLAASVRTAAPVTALRVKTEVVHLDDEICRRCGGLQPGLFAALSVRGVENEKGERGETEGSGNAIALFANPAFIAMGPVESRELGLTSAYEMITQRNGFIAFDHRGGPTNQEQPPAFHVFLPCAMTPVEDQPESSPRPEGGKTILLVGDEPLVRELSRDMLERQGYRVVLASDAGEAEKIGAAAPVFDLLIADAVMPNISGVELARRIRASHPGMKALFISGYAEDAALEGAAFLRKPFSADSLGRKIRQILGASDTRL